MGTTIAMMTKEWLLDTAWSTSKSILAGKGENVKRNERFNEKDMNAFHMYNQVTVSMDQYVGHHVPNSEVSGSSGGCSALVKA